MIDEALPVVVRHLFDGNRLVIGIGHVIAKFDGGVSVINVAQAIEARVECADEIAFGIVKGGGEPAFGVIAEFISHRQLAGISAYRRDDVDEKEGKGDIAHGGHEHVPERPELRIERDGLHDQPHSASWNAQKILRYARQQSEELKHR